jgi:hypothetical protein
MAEVSILHISMIMSIHRILVTIVVLIDPLANLMNMIRLISIVQIIIVVILIAGRILNFILIRLVGSDIRVSARGSVL